MAIEQQGTKSFAQVEDAFDRALRITVTAPVDLDAINTKVATIETGAEVNNISDANATDLTDAGDSALHFHSADRNRSNHSGTQTASTISDFQTQVSANTDVTANTSKGEVSKAGVSVGTRPELNLIEGANVTLTVADNSIDNRIDVTIASSGGGGGGLAGSVEFTGATETVVDSYDAGTDTITSTGHGLSNNTEIYITPNYGIGQEYGGNVMPGGISPNRYYVVNATTDTFQISTTSGGAALDLTANANHDPTKYHFESGVAATLSVTGLTGAKKFYCKVRGKATISNTIVLKTNINPTGIRYHRNNNDFTGTLSGGGNRATNIDFTIDNTREPKLSWDICSVSHNGANTSTVSRVEECYTLTDGYDTNITTIELTHNRGWLNGTRLEVYSVD